MQISSRNKSPRSPSAHQANGILRASMPHTGDCYFITAPTFETKSERDGWLNGVEAVGKMQNAGNKERRSPELRDFIIR
jgi:hypothetical protein